MPSDKELLKRPLARVGIVIVSYGHEVDVKQILSSLKSQLRHGDRIIVVDNHPNKKAALEARHSNITCDVIESENNGFSAGCNTGASVLADSVDVLFFLNPDTRPASNVLDVVREGISQNVAAWMPLLVLQNGLVNSAGNSIHTSGLSWCDGYLDEAEMHSHDVSIRCLSGACMAVRTDWWKKIGGLSTRYFLYYEDTDFSSRIALFGGSMMLLPSALVYHDYDYQKGAHKWFYLERNRPIYVLTTWPLPVLLVLGLQLFVMDIGFWLVALIEGRFKQKMRSFLSFLKVLPDVLKDRSQLQRKRQISSYEFLVTLKPVIDTPVLGKIATNKLLSAIFILNYKFGLVVLKLFRR